MTRSNAGSRRPLLGGGRWIVLALLSALGAGIAALVANARRRSEARGELPRSESAQPARGRGRLRHWAAAAGLATAILAGAAALASFAAVRSHVPAVASSADFVPGTTDTPTPTPTATPTITPSPTAMATPTATATPKPPFVWPADGWVSQPMWAGHPYGIDIAVNTGAPIYAVRDGYVAWAGGNPCCSYGWYIVIDHGDGWSSVYGHLSAFAVSAGEYVSQGQLLGLAGATGKAFGAHLHFELRRGGGVVDPLRYLPRR